MLDSAIFPYLENPLKRTGAFLGARGAAPEAVSLGAFALGIAAAVAAGGGAYQAAIALIVANRVASGLASGIVRAGEGSDFAAYLGIVLDFLFFAAVVLAFAFSDSQNALAAAILLFSLLGLGGTALAYGAVAARHGLAEDASVRPLVDFLAKLVEGTETTLVLILMCLLPDYFAGIALLFAAACLATALFRIVKAWEVLR